MKTAKRRILSFVICLTMLVSVMAAMTVSASATTYPINATVHFITTDTPSTINIIGGDTVSIPQFNVSQNITYTSNFATVIPGANSTIHGLWGTPSGLDAIYSCYGLQTSNDYTGWNNGWDTSSTPNGSYVDKMFNIPQYTKTINYNWQTHLNTWKGYAWMIFVNTTSTTTTTWNASTRTGLLPYYASNFEFQNGDEIYCRYMSVTESWYD